MGAWSVLDKSSPQPLREWLTLTGRKRVLVVAHTVTYIKRLQEVFSLLESDLRVQVLFTAPPHPFGDGVAQLLHRLGSAVLRGRKRPGWNSTSRWRRGPGGWARSARR